MAAVRDAAGEFQSTRLGAPSTSSAFVSLSFSVLPWTAELVLSGPRAELCSAVPGPSWCSAVPGPSWCSALPGRPNSPAVSYA